MNCSLGLSRLSQRQHKIKTFTSRIGCEVRPPCASQCPSRQAEFSLWCPPAKRRQRTRHDRVSRRQSVGKCQLFQLRGTPSEGGRDSPNRSSERLRSAGCHSRGTRTSSWSQLAKIAVIVKGEKIHDMRRNGANSKVQLEERLLFPRLKDIAECVMKLMANKSNEEGIEFLILDFRDAFKQLHMTESERLYMTGPARTTRSCSALSLDLWYGACVVKRSTQTCLTSGRAKTNCFVDDRVIPLMGTATQRKKAASGCVVVVVFPWVKVGLRKWIVWS